MPDCITKEENMFFPPLELLVNPKKDYSSTHLLLGVDWTVVSSFNEKICELRC